MKSNKHVMVRHHCTQIVQYYLISQYHLVAQCYSVTQHYLVTHVCFLLHFFPALPIRSKGQQALGSATRALMRRHYPYRPKHPGAHLCPAKSMVETPIIPAT